MQCIALLERRLRAVRLIISDLYKKKKNGSVLRPSSSKPKGLGDGTLDSGYPMCNNAGANFATRLANSSYFKRRWPFLSGSSPSRPQSAANPSKTGFEGPHLQVNNEAFVRLAKIGTFTRTFPQILPGASIAAPRSGLDTVQLPTR